MGPPLLRVAQQRLERLRAGVLVQRAARRAGSDGGAERCVKVEHGRLSSRRLERGR